MWALPTRVGAADSLAIPASFRARNFIFVPGSFVLLRRLSSTRLSLLIAAFAVVFVFVIAFADALGSDILPADLSSVCCLLPPSAVLPPRPSSLCCGRLPGRRGTRVWGCGPPSRSRVRKSWSGNMRLSSAHSYPRSVFQDGVCLSVSISAPDIHIFVWVPLPLNISSV